MEKEHGIWKIRKNPKKKFDVNQHPIYFLDTQVGVYDIEGKKTWNKWLRSWMMKWVNYTHSDRSTNPNPVEKTMGLGG